MLKIPEEQPADDCRHALCLKAQNPLCQAADSTPASGMHSHHPAQAQTTLGSKAT